MILGIILGLCAACGQSLSYIASRSFLGKHPGQPFTLVAISHVIMGALSALILVVIWPDDAPDFQEYARPLIGSTVFYLVAQSSLFWALKSTAASRAAPLLGMKVFILAILSVVVWEQPLNAAQWGAVGLSVVSAFLLNSSGGSMPWKSIVGVLIACFGYALSDISIRALVVAFSGNGLLFGSILGVCSSYVLCGIICVAGFGFLPMNRKRFWIDALPFTATWFFAMFFLFACFGSIGVIFGNIVQSSRGIISILLGWLISHLGHVHLEEKIERAVLIRRIFAGLMMFSAIVLFYMGA